MRKAKRVASIVSARPADGLNLARRRMSNPSLRQASQVRETGSIGQLFPIGWYAAFSRLFAGKQFRRPEAMKQIDRQFAFILTQKFFEAVLMVSREQTDPGRSHR